MATELRKTIQVTSKEHDGAKVWIAEGDFKPEIHTLVAHPSEKASEGQISEDGQKVLSTPQDVDPPLPADGSHKESHLMAEKKEEKEAKEAEKGKRK